MCPIHGVGRLETKVGMAQEEGVHLLLVLLGLQRTGAIHQKATHRHRAGTALQDTALDDSKRGRVPGTHAPPSVRVAPQGACPRAWHIQEDQRRACYGRLLGVRDNPSHGKSGAHNILAQETQTALRAIGGQHPGPARRRGYCVFSVGASPELPTTHPPAQQNRSNPHPTLFPNTKSTPKERFVLGNNTVCGFELVFLGGWVVAGDSLLAPVE